MRRRGAAVLVLALPFTGCGEAEPLTRAEYVAQAEAICRDVAGRWGELEPPVPEDPVSEEEYGEIMAWDMATGSDLGGEVLDRAGGLVPPAALEDEADATWDALAELVDVLDAYAAAAQARNEAELARLEEAVDDDLDEDYRHRARRLGLKECARGQFLSSWRARAMPASMEPLELDQPLPSPSRNGDGR